MPKFYRDAAMDALLSNIKDNVDSMRLLTAYTQEDTWATVNAASIADDPRVTGDYTPGDSGNGRQIASAAVAGVSATASSQQYYASTATGGSPTTLIDTAQTWGVNENSDRIVEIISGTGSGQTRRITSNTIDTLTVPTWTTNPDATSVYEIRDDLHIAHVDAGLTLVLAVTDETTNQVVTSGNDVDFPAHNLIVLQPV